MKRLLLTLSLTIISISLFAQAEFHFGIKAAPSLAWLRSDTKGYDSDGSKFGFSYGLITEFNFANRYAFATGLDVTYRGGKFKTVQQLKTLVNEDSVVSISSSYNLQYIELPITLKLKTNEIGAMTYWVQIGVAPGMNIRAKMDYEANIQTTTGGMVKNSDAGETKVDVQDDINTLNISMLIGAGTEYTLSGSTVLLAGIHFNNGFTDVFDNDAKVNSNYLALVIGFLF